MNTILANLVIAYGFLRHSGVPTGCCHACEFCCLQECQDKYTGSVTAEGAGYGSGGPETLPEAVAKAGLLQKDNVTVAKLFEKCLDKKAGCPKDAKKWDPKRKSATVECLKEAVADKSLVQKDHDENDEHLQSCPDHGVDICKSRKPVQYFESGMTLEQCTESCLMTECGCAFD
jgi:hypothetical protein